mmetsp:Transcript_6561/g.9636  ORF Transcript_6561/g.9636 Transcript_6561/m.9636 type:complete len:85 (-) Transcript_6561:439-693(-)
MPYISTFTTTHSHRGALVEILTIRLEYKYFFFLSHTHMILESIDSHVWLEYILLHMQIESYPEHNESTHSFPSLLHHLQIYTLD